MASNSITWVPFAVAVVATALMVFFIAGGGGSPEPHHRPEWYFVEFDSPVVRLAWQALWAITLVTCLPVYLLAAVFTLGIKPLWYPLACAVQFGVYYGLTYLVMQVVSHLRR